MSEPSEEDIRKHYIAVKLAQEHLQNVESHLEEVETRLGQLQSMLESINEFSQENVNKIILPVANGIFIEAEKSKSKDFLVNVGANIIVKKSGPEAKKLLKEQQQQLKQYHQQIIHQLQKAEQELAKAQIEAERVVK